MNKVFIPVVGLLFLLFAPLASAGEKKGAEVNQCVNCHKNINDGSIVQREYHDWENGKHAKSGVFCNDCHGGFPDMTDKKYAHGGVRPAIDNQSKIHFQHIPATCGRCHRPEEEAFIGSRHFRLLSTSGKGPNCVTCHTSKEGSILRSENVRERCVECHSKGSGFKAEKALWVPAKAQEVLTQFEKASLSLGWLEDYEKLLEKQHASKELKKEVAALKDRFQGIRISWHKFQINHTADELDTLIEDVEKLRKNIVKK